MTSSVSHIKTVEKSELTPEQNLYALFKLNPREEEITADMIGDRFDGLIAIAKPRDPMIIFVGKLLSDLGIYDRAIIALTKFIEIDSDNMAAYGCRGHAYLQKGDVQNASLDLNRVIESSSVPEQLQEAYLRRSIIDKITSDEEAARADFSKTVELGLTESDVYAKRALIYKQKKDYLSALEDFTNAINIDPENSGFYKDRASTFWDLNKGVDALEDFAKALAYGLTKNSVIEFLEGQLHEISNIFLPGGDYYGKFPPGFPLKTIETRLLELYAMIIGKYSDLPEGHLHRGIYFMSRNDYAKASTDFSSYLCLKNDDVFVIFLQGVCCVKLHNELEASENFQQLVKQGVIDKIQKIKSELAKYPPINNEIDFIFFMAEIGTICSIEETLLALVHLFYENDKSFLNPELLYLAKYLDSLNSGAVSVEDLPDEIVRDVFNYYPYYTSIDDVFNSDGWADFSFYAKLSIMEYILSKVDVYDWGQIDDGTPYDPDHGYCYKFHERELNRYLNLLNINRRLSKQLQYNTIEIKKMMFRERERMLQANADARLDEKNKVIADLSHSIKNLISTIIDPLENLKKEKNVEPNLITIQNALRGANLVRGIVNAMNLSSNGSLNDFRYDAAHNAGKDSMDLEALVIESLKYSVGNMFDGKYFANFVQKYFPTREVFNEAKAEWTNISQRSNRLYLMSFLSKYFFNVEVSTGTASQYILGNEKGSAIKLLILFQELILNAVKYSAFVEKEHRSLNIALAVIPDQISIRVANRFRENLATKTSGIGHIIIDNFSKLLQARPVIRLTDSIYSVEIEFSNLWEEKNENFVRGG